ncbi:MAG: ATP-binding cassette domain-containing protein, partial [Thermodesulfovibrionales bacterium]
MEGVGKDIRLSVAIDAFAYPDGTKALTEIHMEIARGEFVGLLGSNGSGKTTLLTIMDGLKKGFAGKVSLDGKEIKGLSPKE